MISENTHIPLTGRTSSELAANYGYATPLSLAESLPENAKVLDVGSGLSTLGYTISGMRPDVSWTNMDLVYRKPMFIEELNRIKGRDNLRYIAGDIVSPPDVIRDEKYDRVYSFWVLPHISAYKKNKGILAAENMLRILTQDGELQAGPHVWLPKPVKYMWTPICRTVRITGEEIRESSLEKQARRLSRVTRPDPLRRLGIIWVHGVVKAMGNTNAECLKFAFDDSTN